MNAPQYSSETLILSSPPALLSAPAGPAASTHSIHPVSFSFVLVVFVVAFIYYGSNCYVLFRIYFPCELNVI